MKYKFLLLLLLTAIIPPTVLSQQKSGFEITGQLAGLKDGDTVLLGNNFVDWRNYIIEDSCIVNHGRFHLKLSNVPDGPRVYEVDFVGKKCYWGWKHFNLFVNNGDIINLTGSIEINNQDVIEISNYIKITGSPTTTAKISLYPIVLKFIKATNLIDHQLGKIKDSVGFDEPLITGKINEKLLLEKNFCTTLMSPQYREYRSAITYLLSREYVGGGLIPSYHGFFLKNLYDSLDVKTRNSYYGRMLKEMVPLSVGQPFPGFTLPNPNGKMIALKDVVAKSKVTIVWLWASNSFKKEMYEDELKASYKKYHDKGLNIIGLSADSVVETWKKSMRYGEYPWDNVSDLKGSFKGGIIQDIYYEGGHSIPNSTNILLDGKGNIIAFDVYGVELQWYLWKYLEN